MFKDYIAPILGVCVSMFVALYISNRGIRLERQKNNVQKLLDRSDHMKGMIYEIDRYRTKLETKISDLTNIKANKLDLAHLSSWRLSEPSSLSQTEVTKSITKDDLLEEVNDFRQQIEDLEESVGLLLDKNSDFDSIGDVIDQMTEVLRSCEKLKTKFTSEKLSFDHTLNS